MWFPYTTIKHLKAKKALDSSPPQIQKLRLMSRKALFKLISIFNACANLNYLPMFWQELIMSLPLPILASYPISNFLKNSWKSYFQQGRLVSEIEALEFFPLKQFGFKQKYFTIQLAFRPLEFIHQGFEERGAIFLRRIWNI